jgi:hypothetical protein
LKFCTSLENKVFLNLKLAKDGTIESCSYVLLFCILFLIRRKKQMGQKKVPQAAKESLRETGGFGKVERADLMCDVIRNLLRLGSASFENSSLIDQCAGHSTRFL